jgi:hypothetical protein
MAWHACTEAIAEVEELLYLLVFVWSPRKDGLDRAGMKK